MNVGRTRPRRMRGFVIEHSEHKPTPHNVRKGKPHLAVGHQRAFGLTE